MEQPDNIMEIQDQPHFAARATEKQKYYLLAYMEKYPHFAQKEFNSIEGKKDIERNWKALKFALNNIGGGAQKEVKQWQQYWTDQKKNAFKNATDISKRLNRGTGGGSPIPYLSDYDRRVIYVAGGGKRITGMRTVDTLEINEEEPAPIGNSRRAVATKAATKRSLACIPTSPSAAAGSPVAASAPVTQQGEWQACSHLLYNSDDHWDGWENPRGLLHEDVPQPKRQRHEAVDQVPTAPAANPLELNQNAVFNIATMVAQMLMQSGFAPPAVPAPTSLPNVAEVAAEATTKTPALAPASAPSISRQALEMGINVQPQMQPRTVPTILPSQTLRPASSVSPQIILNATPTQVQARKNQQNPDHTEAAMAFGTETFPVHPSSAPIPVRNMQMAQNNEAIGHSKVGTTISSVAMGRYGQALEMGINVQPQMQPRTVPTILPSQTLRPASSVSPQIILNATPTQVQARKNQQMAQNNETIGHSKVGTTMSSVAMGRMMVANSTHLNSDNKQLAPAQMVPTEQVQMRQSSQVVYSGSQKSVSTPLASSSGSCRPAHAAPKKVVPTPLRSTLKPTHATPKNIKIVKRVIDGKICYLMMPLQDRTNLLP